MKFTDWFSHNTVEVLNVSSGCNIRVTEGQPLDLSPPDFLGISLSNDQVKELIEYLTKREDVGSTTKKR